MLRRHVLALILFPLLALAWVGDALFLGVDLSAFDVVLRLPHWKADYEYRGVQQLILSDSPQAHYPERALKWGAASRGERIDFNPFIFTGMRELSQGTGGFITSPFQLFMDVTEAVDWSTFLRLALAGLLMYGFLMALGVKTHAAVIGGVLWAFNLHQIAWLEFPQHLATQLWIPAVFAFNLLILYRGLTWQSLVGVLITNALFFTSGYVQIVLFTYVAIGIFNTVYLAFDSRLAPAQRIRRWVMVHLAFVLSALVLAPRLAAELQILNDGLRVQQDWRLNAPDLGWNAAVLLESVKNMLPDIGDYKRLFSPNFFGGLWGERYFGKPFYGNIVVGSLYTGLLIFVLIPASLLWLRKRRRRPFIAAAACVLLFSFAMIHEDPLMVNAFQQIPKSGYGGYERYITIIVFFLSALAAAGLHVLMCAGPRASRYVFWGAFLLAAASPFLVRIVDPGMPLDRMAYPAAVLAATGVGAAALHALGRWRYLSALLIAVTVADLWAVSYEFNPRMDESRNFPTTATLEHLLADPTPFRVAQVSRRQLYPPNVLQYYGIPSIGGYSTLAPTRYLDFVEEVIDDYHVTDNGQLFFFASNIDAFRLLNVKYVLSRQELNDPRVTLVHKARGYQMYELKDPLPRAYCASTLLKFESIGALLDSIKQVMADYDRPLALVADSRSVSELTADCRVEDIRAHLNGASFTVTTDAPSYVILPYTYYEQWNARADGKATDVLRANHNLLAVPVEPGEHEIRLTYRAPLHTVYGITMAGLGILALAWFVGARRRDVTAWLLAYAGVVLIAYGLLEVPGIANLDLPESVIRPAALSSTR